MLDIVLYLVEFVLQFDDDQGVVLLKMHMSCVVSFDTLTVTGTHWCRYVFSGIPARNEADHDISVQCSAVG